MYNLPDSKEIFHPKGRGNGYLLTLGDKHVYVSGDTQGIPEMRALRGIDLAFVCMNLPYTMDVDEAASAVLSFHPKVVVPYHYKGSNGFSDIRRFKELVQKGDRNVRVELMDFYKN
jgi:L-ascorbate metabolism protein UlaG (beta-lactamase superfamily)